MLKRIGIIWYVLVFAAVLGLVGPQGARAGELRLSVAASMTDAIKELGAVFGEQHPGVRLLTNFAASGALARQIEAGAPADLFISANPKWMDFLVEGKLVAAPTVKTVARNTLVFVGQPAGANSLEELPGLERIALATPSSAPAGEYARQALLGAGLYGELLGAGKLVMAKDVRQALLYADRGEADGAFVYRTDALLAQRVKILFEIPADLYPPVLYPMALTMAGEKNPEAQAFYAFLQSPQAREILGKYGFTF